jgi:hypothetical protein
MRLVVSWFRILPRASQYFRWGHEFVNAPDPTVGFAPGLDARLAARVFAQSGRVHIPAMFSNACAARMYSCLASELPWSVHFNSGDAAYDIATGTFASMPDADRDKLVRAMHASASNGFQYLFKNYAISDEHAAGRRMDLYVMRVYEFLNSPGFLEFARTVTGVRDIALADAQATLYEPGHFLTCHTDECPGKGRVAAYVINLTPEWQVDWGGILNFVDSDGHVAEGYTPRFNALNIARVPQKHSVSIVAPFARGGRYSITGWLRAA